MLFQIDLTQTSPVEVFRQFWANQPGEEDVRAFAERLVAGVVDELQRLDAVIVGSAENWRVERMPVVDRNVLRISIFEMLFEPTTPPAVCIDEAIEVAKRFGSGESGGFINGVLDDVRRRIERGELHAPPR
jgi:N utilization substance protein B